MRKSKFAKHSTMSLYILIAFVLLLDVVGLKDVDDVHLFFAVVTAFLYDITTTINGGKKDE